MKNTTKEHAQPIPARTDVFLQETQAATMTSRDKTYISAGTVIRGGVVTQDDLVIRGGRIEGEISSSSDLYLTGRIQGNIAGRNIQLAGAVVIGDISAADAAHIDANTAVAGDITTQDLRCGGKIKGKVTAHNAVLLEQQAVVLGDLTAASATVQSGVTLQGVVKVLTQAASENALEDLFDDLLRGRVASTEAKTESAPPAEGEEGEGDQGDQANPEA